MFLQVSFMLQSSFISEGAGGQLAGPSPPILQPYLRRGSKSLTQGGISGSRGLGRVPRLRPVSWAQRFNHSRLGGGWGGSLKE